MAVRRLSSTPLLTSPFSETISSSDNQPILTVEILGGGDGDVRDVRGLGGEPGASVRGAEHVGAFGSDRDPCLREQSLWDGDGGMESGEEPGVL